MADSLVAQIVLLASMRGCFTGVLARAFGVTRNSRWSHLWRFKKVIISSQLHIDVQFYFPVIGYVDTIYWMEIKKRNRRSEFEELWIPWRGSPTLVALCVQFRLNWNYVTEEANNQFNIKLRVFFSIQFLLITPNFLKIWPVLTRTLKMYTVGMAPGS